MMQMIDQIRKDVELWGGKTERKTRKHGDFSVIIETT